MDTKKPDCMVGFLKGISLRSAAFTATHAAIKAGLFRAEKAFRRNCQIFRSDLLPTRSGSTFLLNRRLCNGRALLTTDGLDA